MIVLPQASPCRWPSCRFDVGVNCVAVYYCQYRAYFLWVTHAVEDGRNPPTRACRVTSCCSITHACLQGYLMFYRDDPRGTTVVACLLCNVQFTLVSWQGCHDTLLFWVYIYFSLFDWKSSKYKTDDSKCRVYISSLHTYRKTFAHIH